MSSPTFDYSGYLHVLCPICFWEEKKVWEDAVQPVVGVLFGGAYVLRCGHEKQNGMLCVICGESTHDGMISTGDIEHPVYQPCCNRCFKDMAVP